MKRYIIYIILSTALAATFISCATPPEKAPTISYAPTSVPEEGGVRFTKITDVDDAFKQPVIQVQDDKISYSLRSCFSVFNNDEKMAYLSSKHNKSNIFILQLTGGKARMQRTFRESIFDFSISPDDQQIAFSDNPEGNYNIYLMHAESGTAVRQITTSNLNEYSPVFSPDGKKIFFVQAEPYISNQQTFHRYYIWSFDLEKNILIQYSEGYSPSVTPEENRIIVGRTNKETGFSEIWLLDLAKGNEYLLLSARERGFIESAVSPDGKRVAVVSRSLGAKVTTNFDIYIINIDGTNLAQLTFHPGHDLSPKWSQDGKSLYFISQRGSEKGEYNIWKMEL